MQSIVSTVESYVGPYIQDLITLLTGFEVWLQALILLGVAIFVIVGLFVILKKFIKLFVVVAILGGIFYYLYSETQLLDFLKNNVQFIGTLMSIF